MPGLLSLPNELISDIGDELDTRKVFRSTCRRINAVVSPRVFSYITIDIHGDRLDVGISQLEALATKSTCAAEYVHTIDIRRLAANTHRGHTFINGKLVVRKELESSKTEWAQEKMRELLPEALSTLKGATTAIWMIYSGNPDWTSVLVSEFLGTLPALNALHLSMLGKLKPLAHQLRISSLTKLIVKSDPDAAIAEIIANNPHLTYLDILMIRYGVAGDTATLHSLLEKVPLGRPLRLEHLRIDGCYVRFDHRTLPHLRHLRSLKINPISKLGRLGSSPRDLWGTVEREKIPLEAIVAPADDDLIDYLASATDIKRISLLKANTNALAKFFTQVVPRHSKTLVSLSISTNFKGLWYFGEHNVDTLLQCTKLSELSIAVDTSSTDRDTEAVVSTARHIMDMTARMPNLCRLQLFSANREMLGRVPQCRNSAMPRYQSAFKALCNSITSFGPVDPAIHPNLITVGRLKFQPRRGADGVVKYVL